MKSFNEKCSYQQYNQTKYNGDNEPGFKGLLLHFMTKQLLTNYRPGHPLNNPNTSKVNSGTLCQPLRAASLSHP